MANYIATFFTHFDAIAFGRVLNSRGIACQLAPVPRRLSSSCGTCVKFQMEQDVFSLPLEDVEQLVKGDAYEMVLDNR